MNGSIRLVSSSGWEPKTQRSPDHKPAGSFLLSDNPKLWRGSVEVRLEELIRLPRGWDGYNGCPVGFTNAHFALRILESTCRNSTEPPQIVPGSSGDLQIEWHTLNGDIELHVLAPHKVLGWFQRAADGSEEELELTNDFRRVAQWVQEITEQSIAATAAAA